MAVARTETTIETISAAFIGFSPFQCAVLYRNARQRLAVFVIQDNVANIAYSWLEVEHNKKSAFLLFLVSNLMHSMIKIFFLSPKTWVETIVFPGSLAVFSILQLRSGQDLITIFRLR